VISADVVEAERMRERKIRYAEEDIATGTVVI
jgi:hypothetical protein